MMYKNIEEFVNDIHSYPHVADKKDFTPEQLKKWRDAANKFFGIYVISTQSKTK